MIIKLVKWLLNLTKCPYAFMYKIPSGWKIYISCPQNEYVMNGMNNSWKIAMQTERERLKKKNRQRR